jgi:CubicO group peptidase (beta-lactamase class C family)
MSMHRVFTAVSITTIALFVLAGQVASARTGETVAGFTTVDVKMQEIMTKYGVPGGAIAVMRNGELVFARGYGLADTATGRVVQPDTRFRIAGIGQPITAVATMSLIEAGKLSLTTPVRAFLGLATATDPRWDTITVGHLLEHTGGWDSRVSEDPVFQARKIATTLGVASPPSAAQTVQYMVRQPLDFQPGSKFIASNFGYVLLGEIIAKAAGMPYEQYARGLFERAGASGIVHGGGPPAHRYGGESQYYVPSGSPTFPSVYDDSPGIVQAPNGAFGMDTILASGGWVGSPIDLLRFLRAVDPKTGSAAIISPASIQAMLARPATYTDNQDAYFARGWNYRPTSSVDGHWFQQGTLDGTSSIIIRLATGLSFAAVFNFRDNALAIQSDIDNILTGAVMEATGAASADLFTRYVSPTDVVEYKVVVSNSYFLTGRVLEQVLLDGLPASFKRTGATFVAASTARISGAEDAICRYYISDAAAGISSHFYGRRSTDCGLIAANKPASFADEGFDFASAFPDANGNCPADHPEKIYRSFRKAAPGINPNHRYSASVSSYDAMTAQGWAAEGVAFCALSGNAVR